VRTGSTFAFMWITGFFSIEGERASVERAGMRVGTASNPRADAAE